MIKVFIRSQLGQLGGHQELIWSKCLFIKRAQNVFGALTDRLLIIDCLLRQLTAPVALSWEPDLQPGLRCR